MNTDVYKLNYNWVVGVFIIFKNYHIVFLLFISFLLPTFLEQSCTTWVKRKSHKKKKSVEESPENSHAGNV